MAVDTIPVGNYEMGIQCGVVSMAVVVGRSGEKIGVQVGGTAVGEDMPWPPDAAGTID